MEDGWSQVDVALMGPMKPHTCTPRNILAIVCGLSLGCIFMCVCAFVCVLGLLEKVRYSSILGLHSHLQQY